MKKLLKKFFATALAFTMVAASTNTFVFAAEAKDSFALPTQEEILKKIPKTAAAGQVIYGSTTQLDANFVSGWTNAAVNQDIKTLIHGGYDTVAFTAQEKFQVNPIVVKKWSSKVNEDKTKTYTYTIYDNLVYNDGTKITSKDYVFGSILSSSPEWKSLKTTSPGSDTIVGFEAFNKGTTKTFSGYRIIDDYSFSCTIKAEDIPDFFELPNNANMAPMPMHIIAPGVSLTDDGKGATLSKEFTNDLLLKTVNTEKTGYRYNPKVTAGPYMFDNYDASNNSCTVVANPKYLGSMDGTKPQIQKLIIKKVAEATMMDELATGSVDLLAGVAEGKTITKGLDLVDQKKLAYSHYPRAGYGKLAFHCDFGPTQFPAVRQAVAYCLDRDEFTLQFTSGFGIVVNGYYGAAQWEYKENKAALQKRLTNYTYNLAKAKEVLAADGWTLNAEGKDYVEGAGNIRYKKVGDKLMPLIIEWCGSADNQVTNMISAKLPKETEKVGMKINLTQVDFATLLQNYNRQGISKPKYHMYNLATGFATISPVWYYYSTDPSLFGSYNANFIAVEELDKAVKAMKATDPTDLKGWSAKWLEFEVIWNKLMPDIPLYSNDYHDFYTTKLTNFKPSPLWSYRYAIQRASIK